MSFAEEVEKVLAREGGYVNNPNDRGGETNFGITKAVARAHGYTGPMQDLPRATAIAIYRADYWDKQNLDKVEALAPRLAAKLFDVGVNAGIGRAGKWLQRALNLFVGGLDVDGDIGNLTINALEALKTRRGKLATDRNLVKLVNAFQANHYAELAENSPSQKTFIWGWIDKRVS